MGLPFRKKLLKVSESMGAVGSLTMCRASLQEPFGGCTVLRFLLGLSLFWQAGHAYVARQVFLAALVAFLAHRGAYERRVSHRPLWKKETLLPSDLQVC